MSEIIKEGKIKLENNNYTDNIPLGAAASNVYFETEDKSLEDINYENRQSLNSLQEKDKELLKQNSELSLEDEKIKQTIEDMQKNCKEQDKILQDKLDIIDNKINNLQSENITFEDNIIDIQVQQNSQKEEIKKTKENYTKVTTTLPTIEKTGTDLVLENSTNFINKKFNINGQYFQEVTEGTNGTLIQDKNIIVKDVNVEKARLLIKGNHKQETTEGYNNIGLRDASVATKNGLSYSVKNGILNLNGTTTADISILLDLINILELSAKDYYFFMEKQTANRIDVYLREPTEKMIMNLGNNFAKAGISNYKYKITTATTLGKISLFIPKDTTFNNEQIKIMNTDEAKTTYESYTGSKQSPSPDYPQEIETVGNNVNLLNNTASTTSINGIDITIFEDKTVLINGTANENVNFVLQRNLLLEDGKEYTLNSGNDNASSSKFGIYINQYYDNSNHIQASYNSPLNFIYDIKSKDSNNIYLYINKGSTVENELLKPKLEKGTTASPYSMYNQGSVEVIKQNKNFIKLYDSNTLTFAGLTYTLNKNTGEILINGTSISNSWVECGYAFKGGTDPQTKILKKLKINETYTLSCRKKSGTVDKTVSFFVQITEDNKTIATSIESSTTRSDCTGIYRFWVYVPNGTTCTNLVIQPQLEPGSITTNFVEHREKTYILPVQQEMLEGDYINSTEHHTWEKLVLNGTETINTIEAVHGIMQFEIAVKKTGIFKNNTEITCISNYYQGVGFTNSWLKDGTIVVSGNKKPRIMTSQYTTVADFKTFLKSKYDAGTPVIIYYKLETPIELELTKEQKLVMQELKNLQLYIPITSLCSVNEGDPLLSLKYNYVAAKPSTENISEIKATGDNVNYFNKDTLTNYILNEKTGELIPQASWRLSDFIPVEKGKYIFSWDSDNSYFQMKVCYYDKDKAFLSGTSYGENNIYSKILEIPENTKYTRICYSINVSGTPVARENIKLEKGIVKTPYSNYNQGSIKLSVKNQNFLSNLKKTNTSSGLNNSFDNGVFSSKGIATKTWTFIEIGTNLCFKAGTYALSISNLDYSLEFRCHMSNGADKSIWLDRFNLKRSGTFDYDITSISLSYVNFKVGDSIDFTGKLQFEPGDTFNPIITPKGQDFLIPVQQELLSEDKIDKTEYHTWKKITFTGDETLSLERINDYDIANILYKLPENELGVNYQILSNSFIAQDTLIATTQTEGIYLNETSIYFRIDAATAQDSTRFKKWLKEKYNAGTPVIVYYKLKEPKNLELTTEQKKVMNKIKRCEFYDNITYVNNNIGEGQIPASLDIEYFNPSYLLSIIKPYINNLIGRGAD